MVIVVVGIVVGKNYLDVVRGAGGSVPPRWKQEIKQTVGDAQIEVETKDTYKNAERYFARLRKSYGECNPIACVNLLRIAPGKPEAELSRHFHECVELCRNILPNDPNLTVTNFDWHTNVKSMGDASAVEAMWKVLRDKIGQHGYGYGTFERSHGGNDNAQETSWAC